MGKWETEAECFYSSQWFNNLPSGLSRSPRLLFVQRSGLAGAFSMDKMLWEEYEKADLKVTAGQRGESLVITATRLHLEHSLPSSPSAEVNKRRNAEI